MKSFIFLLLALAACASTVAQQTKDGKDVSWKRIAADTSLTFQDVVTICDSLFTNSPVVDRLDAHTGRLNEFQKGTCTS